MSDDTPHKQTNIHGNVVGSATDGGTVNAQNIAGRDINIYPPAPAPPEKPTFPIHEIAHPQNPNFTGREQILQQVAQTLTAGQTTVVTQTIAGLGGVGKTQLALAYSYAHLATYDLIYWLSADSEPGLGEDLMGLARHLKLVAPTQTDQQAALAAVQQWLGQTSHKWLLVYDNADQIEPAQLTRYLPRSGNGHVLITSRNPNYGGLGKVLELGLFELDEAVGFLFRRKGAKVEKGQRGEKEWQAAAGLAEALGRLPLALEHAAAYVISTGSSYAHYYRLFNRRQNEIWRHAKRPDRYHATITTTWELAFEEVKKTVGALDLLYLCCFFNPNGIPLELLEKVSEVDTVSLLTLQEVVTDAITLDEAIQTLRRYSLIQRKNDVLILHQIVQLVIRSNLPQSSREVFVTIACKTISKMLREHHRGIFLLLQSHTSFLVTKILKSTKEISFDFLESSDDIEDFIQALESTLDYWTSNLNEIQRLQLKFEAFIDKLNSLNQDAFQSVELLPQERIVFQKQYLEIQNEIQLLLVDTHNSSFTNIPGVFVKEEREREIIKLLEIVDHVLNLFDKADGNHEDSK